jgi:hypothetical protein
MSAKTLLFSLADPCCPFSLSTPAPKRLPGEQSRFSSKMEVTVPVPGTAGSFCVAGCYREETDVGRYPLAWFGLGVWSGLVSSMLSSLQVRQALPLSSAKRIFFYG